MLTINQQPVTGPAFPVDPDDDAAEPRIHQTPEQQLARIACEIAERIEEMESVKVMAGAAFVAKLASVRAISPVAFRLVVQLMHGNTAPLASYAEQSAKRGISKQTVFLEVRNELEKVRHVFPQLVDQLHAFQRSALAHEQPMSNADAVAQINRR